MKYFLDTEFHEYKKKNFLGLGKGTDTIELISIGIVHEDGDEYYAICKDFDLKAAWKNKWLRENVLRGIHEELVEQLALLGIGDVLGAYIHNFNRYNLKKLLKLLGSSKEDIKRDIIYFIDHDVFESVEKRRNSQKELEFYAYYADYDWVVFCWLFGRMIDLPKGFPMYCRDLKQIMDESVITTSSPDTHNALDDAKWNMGLYKTIKTMNSYEDNR